MAQTKYEKVIEQLSSHQDDSDLIELSGLLSNEEHLKAAKFLITAFSRGPLDEIKLNVGFINAIPAVGEQLLCHRYLEELLDFYVNLIRVTDKKHLAIVINCGSVSILNAWVDTYKKIANYLAANEYEEFAWKALENALMLQRLQKKYNSKYYPVELGALLNKTGKLCLDILELEPSIQLFTEAKNILEPLLDTNHSENEFIQLLLCQTLNYLGIYYFEINETEKGFDFFVASANLTRKLVEINFQKYSLIFARSLNAVGNYSTIGLNDKKNYLTEALEILKLIEEKNGADVILLNKEICSVLNNLGQVYQESNELDLALKSLQESLERNQKMVAISPEYAPLFLTDNYIKLAHFYNINNFREEALNCYNQALASARQAVSFNSKKYLPGLLICLKHLGAYYSSTEYKKSLQFFEEGLDIARKLAKINPDENQIKLSKFLNELGKYYINRNQLENAKECLLEALEIDEILFKKTPKQYKYELAETYNNIGAFYLLIKLYGEAQDYFMKSVLIIQFFGKEEKLKDRYPLSISYTNLANLNISKNNTTLAKKYIEQSIDLKRDLYKEKPRVYAEDLLLSLVVYLSTSIQYSNYEKIQELDSEIQNIIGKLDFTSPRIQSTLQMYSQLNKKVA